MVQKKAAPSKAKKANTGKAKVTPKSPEKWIRTTVMIREANHSKIKSITYWEKKGIKEVVDEALKLYLKGLRVKPLPKK
jgi:ribosomal protein S12